MPMQVRIRKFTYEDIPLKIEWINNPENNQYLHYELPLEYEKTCSWFEKNKHRTDRYDAVILADEKSVGLIGLLSIDGIQAEYYISMGEVAYKGLGVARKASECLLEYAFRNLRLQRVYLSTETGNAVAQKLFEKVGFVQRELRKEDAINRGKPVDRYFYTIEKKDYLLTHGMTPIHYLGVWNENQIYVKREDFIPFSFGGNKARKGKLFFQEIDAGDYDCVVTYGSSHSNHCRIIANMAAGRELPCYIIGPSESSEQTFNSVFMEQFGAEITVVPVEEVHDTIEAKLEQLRAAGKRPYFIPGGGHGNIGTEGYVQCYDEICVQEELTHTQFDYIFLASGTGTTQAGLVCGQLLGADERRIVGISIARKNPRGRDVVLDSVRTYLEQVDTEKKITEEKISEATIFIDDYIGDGYAGSNDEIKATMAEAMRLYGLPLDSTYTGKAYLGMQKYMLQQSLRGKKVLFLHTGGTPLFFDDLGEK